MACGLVVDGGLATELQSMGYDAEQDALFGGSLLAKHPDGIRLAHQRFLESGANVVTTATYQVSVEGLVDNLGVGVDEARGLIGDSVALARDACRRYVQLNRDKCTFAPVVAGSVGPYGACLRDGSEYHGRYVEDVGEDRLVDWHRTRMSCLVAAGADILAVETIPAAEEGLAIVRLLREFPSARAWLSFSCMDSRSICSGERFADAVRRCLRADAGGQIAAVGVNCTHPTFVSDLLESCGKVEGVPFVVYPNSGEDWDGEAKRWVRDDGRPRLHELVPRWLELGAGLVGGCCRITSAEIEPIARAMDRLPKSLK